MTVISEGKEYDFQFSEDALAQCAERSVRDNKPGMFTFTHLCATFALFLGDFHGVGSAGERVNHLWSRI